MASSPESEMAGQNEPSGLSGVAATLNTAAPVYITEEFFSSTILGLEQKIDALIASQSGTKRDRSPSITKDPQTEEQGARDDEFLSGDQKEADDSSSEDSNTEGSGSPSERFMV